MTRTTGFSSPYKVANADLGIRDPLDGDKAGDRDLRRLIGIAGDLGRW